jgi:hypothetical protein
MIETTDETASAIPTATETVANADAPALPITAPLAVTTKILTPPVETTVPVNEKTATKAHVETIANGIEIAGHVVVTTRDHRDETVIYSTTDEAVAVDGEISNNKMTVVGEKIGTNSPHKHEPVAASKALHQRKGNPRPI